MSLIEDFDDTDARDLEWLDRLRTRAARSGHEPDFNRFDDMGRKVKRNRAGKNTAFSEE